MVVQSQFKTIRFSTKRKVQLVDLTHDVEQFVHSSAVEDGVCIIHAPHATGAIILNENESGLVSDMEAKFQRMFEEQGYKHDRIDDNASAHIASAVLGNSRMLPIRDGKLIRGTWQNVFFVDMDGPRSERRVVVEVLGN